MDDNELKPCQHCGRNHLRFERWVDIDGFAGKPNTVLYRPFCEACLYAPDQWEETPEKAIQYWNSRPIEDQLQAELAAAREDADRLATALEKRIVLCDCEDCKNPAAWMWTDWDGKEYVCDLHKDENFYVFGPHPMEINAEGLKALAQHEAGSTTDLPSS